MPPPQSRKGLYSWGRTESKQLMRPAPVEVTMHSNKQGAFGVYAALLMRQGLRRWNRLGS